MKIILLQDVAKIGRRHQVVNVPDGYALNQLIPRKMAQPATPDNLKRIEKMKHDKEVTQQVGVENFTSAIQKLQSNKPTVYVQANEQGHLFKAVSQKDIAEAALVVGAHIAPESVSIQSPIKEIGEHAVTLKRGTESAEISLLVVSK